MQNFSKADFGTIVAQDFTNRNFRAHGQLRSITASAGAESKALGHPAFEELEVGEHKTANMVAVFLDLTNFTGRTFWDDQNDVVALAHAVLSAFVETVQSFGGHPLGLRGDGLFAGFSPGDPAFTATMALSACAFALDGVESEVNPWLERQGIARIQARAGLDYGPITFVRSGSGEASEINPLGFAANFAAKCEKTANSWEIVAGHGLRTLVPTCSSFAEHENSPKKYTRDYETKEYRFYDYRWRNTLPHLEGVTAALAGTSTTNILAH